MLKRLILALALAGLVTLSAYGASMTSDPQSGVTSHETSVPALNLSVGTLANPDGSLNVNLSQFPVGWHDAEVRSCEDYVVEDPTSGVITRQESCSDPAPVRFKVPNPNAASGFKIKQ
jgi:hypothetical protein